MIETRDLNQKFYCETRSNIAKPDQFIHFLKKLCEAGRFGKLRETGLFGKLHEVGWFGTC